VKFGTPHKTFGIKLTSIGMKFDKLKKRIFV